MSMTALFQYKYTKGFMTLLGISGFWITSLVMAEPIVESRTGHSVYQRSSSSAHNQTLTVPQIETLEQEIRQLRGQLEEQAYEIKRLSKSQQDLYADLERKLQTKGSTNTTTTATTPRAKNTSPTMSVAQTPAVKPAAAAAVSTPAAPKVTSTISPPVTKKPEVVDNRAIYEPMNIEETDSNEQAVEQNIGPVSSTVDTTEEEIVQMPLSGLPEKKEDTQAASTEPAKPAIVVKGILAEKNMYENAYNLVLNKRYSEAVPALQAFLTQYPQGQYAPNGHYWLGEVYSIQGRANKNAELLNKASVEFMAITTQFPNHQKAMDALLKLGILESDKGNPEAARQYLTHVKERYPGTSVARIASTHLQRLK